MDTTLFLIPPPETQDPAAWVEWMQNEARKEAAQKAAATRATKVECVAIAEGMAKINGRWCQRSRVAFSGSAEDNTMAIDGVIDASQESDLARKEHPRGTKSKARRARKNAARKGRR